MHLNEGWVCDFFNVAWIIDVVRVIAGGSVDRGVVSARCVVI
jgi:hypothetical protein